MLHIGSVRTAYYNWLHARRHNGKMLLRIEDTDRQRSTQQAINAIIDGLNWLKLHHDGEVIYQSTRVARHKEVVQRLLDEGKAYHCYASQTQIEDMRKRSDGKAHNLNRMLRDHTKPTPTRGAKSSESMTTSSFLQTQTLMMAQEHLNPTVRLATPSDGTTTINDLIQGRVTVANDTMDDMVLLRSDGSPTYMLAVVVDDHDMGITDIIRGDDHLTNAFRQWQLYTALGWTPPRMAHMPLLHGNDGKKLSKRHGALAVQEWRDMGYLPDALLNYLLRLGWSHGDDEIITMTQAQQWFDVKDVGRAAARFDEKKLNHINSNYLRDMDDDLLTQKLLEFDSSLTHTLQRMNKTRREFASFVSDFRDHVQTLVELRDEVISRLARYDSIPN